MLVALFWTGIGVPWGQRGSWAAGLPTLVLVSIDGPAAGRRRTPISGEVDDRVQNGEVTNLAANRIIGLPHGTRENRRYGKRLQLLQEHGFDPAHHLDRQAVALEWHQAPSGLAEAVANYFQERDEDAPESA